MMEYRTLGSSGVSVSTLALGTMTFGTETDEEASPRPARPVRRGRRQPGRHRRRVQQRRLGADHRSLAGQTAARDPRSRRAGDEGTLRDRGGSQ